MSLRDKEKCFPAPVKPQNCESCGEEFLCQIGLKGCWCSSVELSEKTREYLRENFKLCLCPECLRKFELRLR
jgi:hypothetical protein